MPCLQMHHVLYEDGENEWMCLAKEPHAWVPTLPGRAYPAGLPPGEAHILMNTSPRPAGDASKTAVAAVTSSLVGSSDFTILL